MSDTSNKKPEKKRNTEPSQTVRYYIGELARANEDAAIMGIKTSILNAQAKALADSLRRVN